MILAKDPVRQREEAEEGARDARRYHQRLNGKRKEMELVRDPPAEFG